MLRSWFVDACDIPEHISTIVSTDGGAIWSVRQPIVVSGATTLKEVDPCAIAMADGVSFTRVGTAFSIPGLAFEQGQGWQNAF
ncbi:MAG: hypothetical protein EXS00_07815 [Phycisphaerales bacterium]|nr:hypothetical protein [Phycisphaerales bacterium]